MIILIFLGLKKQEEDRARDNLRQAQIRKAGIDAGTSTGMVDLRTRGFETPSEVNMDDEEDNIMLSEDIARIRAEMERSLQRQREAQQATSSTARSDLDEAHRQSVPVGVMDEEDMPPLVNIEEGEEEEDFDDDPELIPADDDETTQAPGISRKHKETIDYSNKITKWQDKSVQEDDIRFQLYLRGIALTPEQEEEISKLKVKGKGRNQTRKDYLINYVDRLIQTGKWTDQVNDQLLQKRMVEWREMKKGKGKGSGSAVVPSQSASSSTTKDILVAGAKAGVETLAKAGATAIAKSFLPT